MPDRRSTRPPFRRTAPAPPETESRSGGRQSRGPDPARPGSPEWLRCAVAGPSVLPVGRRKCDSRRPRRHGASVPANADTSLRSPSHPCDPGRRTSCVTPAHALTPDAVALGLRRTVVKTGVGEIVVRVGREIGGPATVLLHGAAGSWTTWTPLIAE